MSDKKNNISEDVHQEFQLERLILFSDAVFAIVITLMAIEIHLPENAKITSTDELLHLLLHLTPALLAYSVSFGFIGTIWYQHLKLFSLLKAYDVRLVCYNLLLLFFVGLFPFCATLIAKGSQNTMLPFYIYIGIIFSCLSAITLMDHHIFISRPQLRNERDHIAQFKKYRERKFSLVLIAITVGIIMISSAILEKYNLANLSMMLFMLYPVLFLALKKKYT